MKRFINATLILSAALFVISCAKTVSAGPNDANKRYLEAWMHVNGINMESTGLGIYILDNKDGDKNGAEITRDGFALLDFKITDLDGNITSYTGEEIAKQLGEYNSSEYYGPEFITTHESTIYAGVYNMLEGMKVGGYRKALIPSWLLSYKSYSTEAEYLAQEASSTSSSIYEVYVRDFTDTVTNWELDSLERFFRNDKILIDGKPASQIFVNENGTPMDKTDTTQVEGFYYKQLSAPASTEKFSSDTAIFINYIGRTLDGRVFDTTYEKVAKDNNIYSSSRTYEPVQINWPSEAEDEGYDKITMGTDESEIISGFALTLWQMHAMEKGVGIFYSPLGYGSTGNGNSIPGYAPLIFEIEVVAKPED